MTLSAVNDYINRLLKGQDEDAFHSLMEGGDLAVIALSEAISKPCSDDQFQRIIEVIQEIRTEKAQNVLKQLCSVPFSPRWVTAAEALFYNSPTPAIIALRESVREEIRDQQVPKRKLIDEMEASFSHLKS